MSARRAGAATGESKTEEGAEEGRESCGTAAAEPTEGEEAEDRKSAAGEEEGEEAEGEAGAEVGACDAKGL